ncbi:MAG TPA: DUF6677 family protein [Candidatus Polarisedimenticolia bacterium]|nr:DUF6677 family protein [Candidatus Polarisedimenticolia bacterium]
MTETTLEAEAPAPAAQARPRVNPVVPCLLAWLLPGLGHAWLGRHGRAAAFFFIVLSTFGLGLASGGSASVIDRQQPLSFLAALDGVAMGPLDLVARKVTLGEVVYRLPDAEGDPRRQTLLTRIRERVKIATFEYGSTFLLTAGLMNILLILDAFDIASGRKD